eukprot:TRINITY_DN4658_c0_g3_i1.p1 TRINITY_DN4658_c0_g3~~TRINITY_DN4658_c0_g3_i1.p1  ORF type:complete len:397 (-),score=89.99 TRINITY_DN4658_c0_g3_i1:369-1559(-)
MDDDLAQEIELLRAVFGDELVVEDGSDPTVKISMYLQQSETVEKQFHFVKCLFVMLVERSGKAPIIRFPIVRGLSTHQEIYILSQLCDYANELEGSAMLFQLLEKAREIVFQLNSDPSGECPICLDSFTPIEVTPKQNTYISLPKCHHRFHVRCVLDCLDNQLQYERSLLDDPVVLGFTRKPPYHNLSPGIRSTNIIQAASHMSFIHCPVCRTSFAWDEVSFFGHLLQDRADYAVPKDQPVDAEGMAHYFDSADFKRHTQLMEAIYKRQSECGGIINTEEKTVMLSAYSLPSAFQVLSVAPVGKVTSPATPSQHQRQDPDRLSSDRQKQQKLKDESRSQGDRQKQQRKSAANVQKKSGETKQHIVSIKTKGDGQGGQSSFSSDVVVDRWESKLAKR